MNLLQEYMYVVQSASTFKIKTLFYVHAGLHHHMWLHNFRELLMAPFKTILCILLNEVQAIPGVFASQNYHLEKRYSR